MVSGATLRDAVEGSVGAVSILLADDRSETRAGARRALEHHGFAIVAEAGDADQAVTLAIEHRPQVCLLEVDLPGDAITAIEQSRRRSAR